MSINVTKQNVDQVLNKFENFVSDANASQGKGAVAYLFPGLRNTHLESIDKPIFASRSFWRNSSVFRSSDDKQVNNYVRHVFLIAIATKLKCEVADVPRVFEWAGKLGDLKVNDFNADGRPLTARRIETILADLKTIEYKRLSAVDNFRAAKGDDAKLPAYMASAGALSAHKLSRARQAALPKLDTTFVKNARLSVAALEDTTSDNYMLGREQMTEVYSNVSNVRVSYSNEKKSKDGTYNPNKKHYVVTEKHMRAYDPGFKAAVKAGEAEVKRFKSLINDDLSFNARMSQEDRELISSVPKTGDDGRPLTKKKYLENIAERLGWQAGDKYVKKHIVQYDKDLHEQRLLNNPVLQARLEDVRERVKAHGGNLEEELQAETLKFRKEYESTREVHFEFTYGGTNLAAKLGMADDDSEPEVNQIY